MCWYSLWNFKWRRFPSSITGDMIPTIIIHWSQQKQKTSSCGGWVFTFLSVVVSDGTMMLATTFYATKDLPLTCPMSPVHLKHFLLMLSKFFSSSPGSTIDGSMVDLIIVYMWEFHLPQPRLEWFFFLFTSATVWRPFFTLNEHYWVTFCPHT